MVIVLTSVGLPPDDITLIVAIDWILTFKTVAVFSRNAWTRRFSYCCGLQVLARGRHTPSTITSVRCEGPGLESDSVPSDHRVCNRRRTRVGFSFLLYDQLILPDVSFRWGITLRFIQLVGKTLRTAVVSPRT
ncbi:hypothetical protein XENOCAPTIV_008690 [Xenoophorus captivus]|uniref:Uncharacterized protein n=1 Tax=Xenoophorus captivus TaxID=1517983 RepID=A0ABV0Q9Q2_9TELE